MKRVTKMMLLCLSCVMLLSFAACAGNENEGEPTKAPATGTTAATDAPTAEPTDAPTAAPTEAPTEAPTAEPTEDPKHEDMSYTIPYVTKNLVALYEGYYNSASGQKTDATVWEDLSGNGNNITDIKLSENCAWNEKGLHIDSQKIILPEEILDTVNGEEFTIEFAFTDFEGKGHDYYTFINNDGNDNFSFFVRVNTNQFELKCNNAMGTRPTTEHDGNYFEGKTLAVTFVAGDYCAIYVDGEEMGFAETMANCVDATGNMFIGHPDASRNYAANIVSLRVYDRALSEAELKANAEALGKVAAK